jgi:hypothetical protein
VSGSLFFVGKKIKNQIVIKAFLCNFLVRLLKSFFKFEGFFAHKKLKKAPSKVAQKTQIHFFPLLPGLPKRPKQKNSRSKMWLKEQLYIELGYGLKIY